MVSCLNRQNAQWADCRFWTAYGETGLVSLDLGRALNRAQNIRQIADYTGDVIEPEDVTQLLRQASEFVILLKTRFLL
jgi:uncharacterized protein (UPF0332 family)